jgi:hypothetical protein
MQTLQETAIQMQASIQVVSLKKVFGSLRYDLLAYYRPGIVPCDGVLMITDDELDVQDFVEKHKISAGCYRIDVNDMQSVKLTTFKYKKDQWQQVE